MYTFKKAGFCLMICSSGMIFMFIPKCALRPYINPNADEEIAEAFRQVQVFDENDTNDEDSSFIEKLVKKE